MIVSFEPGVNDRALEQVGNLLAEQGLEALVSRSRSRTFVSVGGEEAAHTDLNFLAAVPGVERVVAVPGGYPLVAFDSARSRLAVHLGQKCEIGPSTFTLIAGPCAIETMEQSSIAWAASVRAGATVLRGDLFKHRTSPYSFQGLGLEALEFLAEQRRRLGLPYVLEVLFPADIDLVAEVADVIRIGSRNMQNRELLLACGRTEKPIMLKRGLSATIEEWLLAAETIASAGNLNIILCERGIRTFEPATRNTLDLSAIPVVQQRSHLPVIVDPSHASGSRSLVAPLALAAVAAGADGIMLDVHPHPEKALCDGAQALLPAELERLGAELRSLAAWIGRTVEPALVAAADGGASCEATPPLVAA